jgi:hypothetical protein
VHLLLYAVPIKRIGSILDPFSTIYLYFLHGFFFFWSFVGSLGVHFFFLSFFFPIFFIVVPLSQYLIRTKKKKKKKKLPAKFCAYMYMCFGSRVHTYFDLRTLHMRICRLIVESTLIP